MTSTWRNVTHREPCQVCNAPDWCGRSEDGQFALCRRTSPPGSKAKTDRHGVPYSVVRLQDGPDTRPDTRPAPARVETDPELLDRAYRALLDCPATRLAQGHREALLGRGMTPRTIDRHAFRSMPAESWARAKALHAIARAVGSQNLGRIPGVLVEEGVPRLYAYPGLLIPTFDYASGRLAGFRVRIDRPAPDGKKYRWLSSAPHGARGRPTCFLAFPEGQAGPWTVARLIEGELKAVIAAQFTDVLTVSAPGVALWRMSVPVFKQLGVEQVRIAFDNDWRTNPSVRRALVEGKKGLEAEGFTVGIETWPAQFKGLDDFLAASAHGGVA